MSTTPAGPAAVKNADDIVLDCVIVGAGLSGCAAALSLQSCGASILILESRNRAGGRTFTVDGFDLGGAFVGPTQDRILRVAREMGVSTAPVRTEGDSILQLRGHRSVFSGVLPPFGWLAKLDVNYLWRTTDSLAAQVNSTSPWTSPLATQMDSQTVAAWLNSESDTYEGRILYEHAVRASLCRAPEEISMLYWLWYVSSSQGMARLLDTEGGAQERTFVGGSQQISDRMIQTLNERHANSMHKSKQQIVYFEHAVQQVIYGQESIEANNDGVRGSFDETSSVLVQCANGSSFRTRHVIFALPPALLPRIHFSPPLPPRRLQLCQSMHMGSVIKVWVVYSRPFWREDGRTLSANIFSDIGPTWFTFESTKLPKEGETQVFPIVGFFYGDFARIWAARTQSERRQAVLAQYAAAFDCPLAFHPLKYIEQDWSGEQWSGGGYGAAMGPLALTQLGPLLREPLPNNRCHFASTETATRWSGYMDGAIQSGERAAHDVHTLLAHETSGRICAPIPFVEVEPAYLFEECQAIPLPPLTLFERYAPRARAVKRIILTTLITSAIVIATATLTRRKAHRNIESKTIVIPHRH
jgi:monoamine oxidase